MIEEIHGRYEKLGLKVNYTQVQGHQDEAT